jgi:hypothetical protein
MVCIISISFVNLFPLQEIAILPEKFKFSSRKLFTMFFYYILMFVGCIVVTILNFKKGAKRERRIMEGMKQFVM